MTYHMNLTPALMSQVIEELREAFPSNGTVCFDSLIPNLRLAMESFVSMKFSVSNIKLYSDRYYPQADYTTAKQKAQLEMIRLIFSTCFILLFSKHEAARAQFASVHTASDMLAEYVRHDHALFSYTHTSDAIGYVHFRNIVKAALLVVPTRLNKRVIIDAACRLQTPPRIYSWGKSMCAELRRLAAIYHVVSGVPVEVRDPRARGVKASNQIEAKAADKSSKRNVSHVVSNSSSSGSDSEEMHSKKTSRAFLLPSSTKEPDAVSADRTAQYSMADYYPTASDLLYPLVVPGDQRAPDAYLFPESDKNASLSEIFCFHPDYMNGVIN